MKHSRNRHRKYLAVVLSLGLLLSGFSASAQNQPVTEDTAVSSSEVFSSALASVQNVGALSVEEQRVAALEAAAQSFPVVASALEQSEGLVEGQDYAGYIVKLKTPASGDVRTFNADPVPNPETIEGVKLVSEDMNLYVAEDLSAVLQEIPQEEIVSISPNYRKEPYLLYPPTDPYYKPYWQAATPTQEGITYTLKRAGSYQFEAVNARYTYEQNILGTGVKIGVVDSGVYASHEDFSSSNIATGYNVKNNSTNASDNSNVATRGHGTFISGLIAATPHNEKGIAGLAPKSTIIPIKVFDEKGAYTSDVIKGIEKAVELGAQVINLSLGNNKAGTEEKEAIQKAVDKGVLVIAAAGNDGSTATSYPAGYDNTISVGAVMPTPDSYEIDASLSDYQYTLWTGNDTNGQIVGSQMNNTVDVVAPGAALPGMGPDATNHYKDSGYGTSYAAPIVVALAALCKEVYPALSQAEFLEILKQTSVDYGPTGISSADGQLVRNNLYGYGLVNFDAAVKKAKQLAGTDLHFIRINNTAANTVEMQAQQIGGTSDYNWQDDGTMKKLEIHLVNPGETPISATICVAEYDSTGKTLMTVPKYVSVTARENGYYAFSFTATPENKVKIFALNNNQQALAVSKELTVPAA